MKQIYIAGPDVFFLKWGIYSKIYELICDAAGFVALLPVDNEESTSLGIYQNNLKLIDKCDAVIANCSPFRGPSIDPGTAFEIGYATALKKPVFSYTNSKEDYLTRVRTRWPVKKVGLDIREVIDDSLVENFGNHDNLMIEHSPKLWVENISSVEAFCTIIAHMKKSGI